MGKPPQKPISPDDFQQRTLEGPEDGPLRGWVRERKDTHDRWAWARGLIVKTAAFIMGGAALLAAGRQAGSWFGWWTP